MKICASLSSESDKDRVDHADMVEIRLDLMDHVPDIPDKKTVVTFRKDVDLSVLPRGFDGIIDIGEQECPTDGIETMSSYHDYEKTPSTDEISSIIRRMGSGLRKAAFTVNSFTDLDSICRSSIDMDCRHIILGMEEMGTITRIRQDVLKNEFTFAHVGRPTAPGQLSVDCMRELGEDCMITGITGYPLSKSCSPFMHNAAFRKTGIKGIYLKFESQGISDLEKVIVEYNVRGINVTIPYKHEVIRSLDCVDDLAEEIGAVNTVVNDNGRLKGYNTDIAGIEKALSESGFDPHGKRVLILGSGGAARACAYLLHDQECDVTITGRNAETGKDLSERIGCIYRPEDSVSPMMYDLIVNCTPVGMYGTGDYPININRITRQQTVFDMVYGCDTLLIETAKKNGAGTISGKDMLAGQGAASFELWTGEKDLFQTMRDVL